MVPDERYAWVGLVLLVVFARGEGGRGAECSGGWGDFGAGDGGGLEGERAQGGEEGGGVVVEGRHLLCLFLFVGRWADRWAVVVEESLLD